MRSACAIGCFRGFTEGPRPCDLNGSNATRSSGFDFDKLFGLVSSLYHLDAEVAARVGLTQSAASRAVYRGERLTKEKNYSLDLLNLKSTLMVVCLALTVKHQKEE